jgi:hypothetical protein
VGSFGFVVLFAALFEGFGELLLGREVRDGGFVFFCFFFVEDADRGERDERG